MPNHFQIPHGILSSGLILPLLVFFYKLSEENKSAIKKMHQIAKKKYKDSIMLYCYKTGRNIFKLTDGDFMKIDRIFEDFMLSDLKEELSQEKNSLIEESKRSSISVATAGTSVVTTILLATLAVVSVATLNTIMIGALIAVVFFPMCLIFSKWATDKTMNTILKKSITNIIDTDQDTRIEKLKETAVEARKEMSSQIKQKLSMNQIMTKFIYDNITKPELDKDIGAYNMEYVNARNDKEATKKDTDILIKEGNKNLTIDFGKTSQKKQSVVEKK